MTLINCSKNTRLKVYESMFFIKYMYLKLQKGIVSLENIIPRVIFRSQRGFAWKITIVHHLINKKINSVC